MTLMSEFNTYNEIYLTFLTKNIPFVFTFNLEQCVESDYFKEMCSNVSHKYLSICFFHVYFN
jgi:hypothetical protein